jgi:hypothetical protein
VKAPLGNGMLVEDVTGDARVRPDEASLDGDHIERQGRDPAEVGVSVQAVIAWAMQFRPDLITRAKDDACATICPAGSELVTCTTCVGYGVVCTTKRGSEA